jgi:hypothetical protein
MKRFLAMGLAATLVASSLTAGGTAFAGQQHWKPGPPHMTHPHPGSHQGSNLGPFFFGTFLGLALAPAFYPRAPIYYPGPNRHVALCMQWYGPWYNPATDLWTDSYGGVHRCTAPY